VPVSIRIRESFRGCDEGRVRGEGIDHNCRAEKPIVEEKTHFYSSPYSRPLPIFGGRRGYISRRILRRPESTFCEPMKIDLLHTGYTGDRLIAQAYNVAPRPEDSGGPFLRNTKTDHQKRTTSLIKFGGATNFLLTRCRELTPARGRLDGYPSKKALFPEYKSKGGGKAQLDFKDARFHEMHAQKEHWTKRIANGRINEPELVA